MLTRMPRIQKEMLACLQCGYCIEVCEAHAQTPWESVTPRGKIYYLTQIDKKNLMDSLLNRNIDAGGDFADALYKCTGCGNCETVCHANLELVALWENIREWLVDNGLGPMPEHKKLVERISTVRNPYGESQEDRDAWWPADVKKEPIPDVIMFAGCTGSFRMKDIPKAGVTVMDRAGVKQNCLGASEICCTSPALRTGATTLTRRAADEIVNKADAIGAKDMVMTCAGCYKTVSTDFGNHYSMAGQNVYHFTQYVEKLLADRKLPLNHPIEAKVTYHDPCHLGRHAKVFDSPRNVLKKIKGVQFVEMERNRQSSRCCGAGGGYKSAFNDLAVNVAAERVKDAEAVGAQIIATACPFCVLNLTAGAKKIGSKVKVMDISEMLLKVTAPVEPVAAPAPAPAAVPEPKPEPVPVAPAPKVLAVPPDVEYLFDEETGANEPIYEDDSDIMMEEKPGDSGELKLRRRLWKRGYRYRKVYGKDKITIAFLKAKVAAFVGEDNERHACDSRLEGNGWVVLRYKDAGITDARPEASEIIDAIERSLRPPEPEEVPEDIGQAYEGADGESAFDENDEDVLGEERPDDSGELKLRRRLWGRGYRYRKMYGRERITIAFLKARVATFVSPQVTAKDKDKDDALRTAGWTVLRFKEPAITDAKKEADKVIAAIEKNLNALMNEETASKKGKVEVDEELFAEERDDDPADLKIRRILWRSSYRYRRRYGREKITVAFRRAKVGAFVCADTYRRKGDDQLVKRGWTIMRFKESNVTDGKKEADKVMSAVDRNLHLLSKGIIPEGANITGADVLDQDVEENTPEYRLRMVLWRSNRYRRNYSEYNINIAYPAAKVAVFVDELAERQECDGKLEADNWTVLRFKGSNITDGKKEADKVIAAIEKNKEFLEELEFEGSGGEEEEDLSYLLDDTPEGRFRRAVWNKRIRYRRNYSRYKIDMAFVKVKVAVFADSDGKGKSVDDTLEKKGWRVLRFKIGDITDGKKEADIVHKAVKDAKKAGKKKKKKPAAKKK